MRLRAQRELDSLGQHPRWPRFCGCLPIPRTFASWRPPRDRTRKSRLSLLALIALIAFGLAIGFPLITAGQASRTVVWDRIDVVVEARPNGSFHVTERDRIQFYGGPFRRGFAEISLARVESIANIRVFSLTGTDLRALRYVTPNIFSMDVANTFTYRTVDSNLLIEWSFSPTTSQSRTFQIEFDAHGALRVYDDVPDPYQEISWVGVDRQLTQIANVNNASLTFILPRPVDPDETFVVGPGGEQPRDHTSDGRSWTWSVKNLGRGDSLAATLQFEPLVAATKPSWQDASDRREQLMREREARGPLLNLVFLGLGLLIAVGGGLAVLIAWWTKGRDPEIGPVAEYIVAPPGDLPPAVVGALVDEQVDHRDIVATLVDLGRRGVLRIEETGENGPKGKQEFMLTIVQQTPRLSRFEETLLETLFGGNVMVNRPLKMAGMRERVDKAGPRLRGLLYDELLQRGYFVAPPAQTRSRWKSISNVLFIVALIAGWIAIDALADIDLAIGIPIAALLAIGLLVGMVARVMPQKTHAGAEAAAMWRAFRNYLAAIDRFEHLEQAQGLFERYLPYAIAFGLETSWVKKFSQVSTPTPSWYGSANWIRLVPTDAVTSWGAGAGPGRVSQAAPSLQGVSDQFARSLQASSNSLFALFDSAGDVFSGASSAASAGGRAGVGFSGSLRGAGLAFTALRAAGGGLRGFS